MVRVKGFIGCEVIRNGGCGFAKHIGHNGIQCHIADGKGILEAVLLAAFHRNQFIAVAGKLTQNADIQIWDEAALYKANTKQITNPFGVFRVILVSLYSLYPFGIGNDNIDFIFQNIKDRNPVFSCGFHTDIKAVVVEKPLTELPHN